MKTLMTLVLALVLFGCATTAKYNDNCLKWVGQSETSLVQAWGIPRATYQMDANTKMLEYVVGNSVTSSYNQFTDAVTTSAAYCKTTFTILNGSVLNYHWEGNTCRAK